MYLHLTSKNGKIYIVHVLKFYKCIPLNEHQLGQLQVLYIHVHFKGLYLINVKAIKYISSLARQLLRYTKPFSASMYISGRLNDMRI